MGPQQKRLGLRVRVGAAPEFRGVLAWTTYVLAVTELNSEIKIVSKDVKLMAHLDIDPASSAPNLHKCLFGPAGSRQVDIYPPNPIPNERSRRARSSCIKILSINLLLTSLPVENLDFTPRITPNSPE